MAPPAHNLVARGRAAAKQRRTSWLGDGGRRYFLLVYALAILGLVYVFSASFPLAGRPTASGGNPYYYFTRQLLFVGGGLILMLIVSRLPVRILAWLSVPALLVGAGLMIATLFVGYQIGGSRCWFPWPLPWQPSELTKVAYVVFLALVLARKPLREENGMKVVLLVLAVASALALILMLQSDLGMAMLVLAIALVMLLLAGLQLRYWVPLLLGVVGVGVFLASLKPYRWARIEAWLHPEEHLQGAGYHIYNMLIALARGGPLGAGLGMSPDKWTSLPVPHTDSVFCVLGGELGLWGGVGVIVLMALLALWAFNVASQSRDRLGWFMAAGAGAALALQGFINIAVATATIPTTGLTLPFISSGGSSLVSCLLAAGVVLAVAAEHRPRRER